MDGVLSQEEISALLNNSDAVAADDNDLSPEEIDAIGEISNIRRRRRVFRW